MVEDLLLMYCIALAGVLFLFFREKQYLDALLFLGVNSLGYFELNCMCPIYTQEIFVSMLGVTLVLIFFRNENWLKRNQALIFALLGSVTMFFTRLSFPLVT